MTCNKESRDNLFIKSKVLKLCQSVVCIGFHNAKESSCYWTDNPIQYTQTPLQKLNRTDLNVRLINFYLAFSQNEIQLCCHCERIKVSVSYNCVFVNKQDRYTVIFISYDISHQNVFLFSKIRLKRLFLISSKRVRQALPKQTKPVKLRLLTRPCCGTCCMIRT